MVGVVVVRHVVLVGDGARQHSFAHRRPNVTLRPWIRALTKSMCPCLGRPCVRAAIGRPCVRAWRAPHFDSQWVSKSTSMKPSLWIRVSSTSLNLGDFTARPASSSPLGCSCRTRTQATEPRWPSTRARTSRASLGWVERLSTCFVPSTSVSTTRVTFQRRPCPAVGPMPVTAGTR